MAVISDIGEIIYAQFPLRDGKAATPIRLLAGLIYLCISLHALLQQPLWVAPFLRMMSLRLVEKLSTHPPQSAGER